MAGAIKKAATAEGGKIYYSISEVAELTDVKPHVLRYWESKFKMLKPKKNRAGNRMYRPKEIDLILRIKELLYDRRYTIAGARRTLLDERKSGEDQVEMNFDKRVAERSVVVAVKKELEEILEMLSRNVSARG
jgi:DNA-binding transcriptional MerR regulator